MTGRCMLVLWVSAIVGLSSGCTGPTVKTQTVPQVHPATSWRTDLGPSAPIDAQWWTRFDDPMLVSLIESALSYNSDIAIAAGRVREARANVKLARSALFPTLEVAATGGRSRSVSAFGTPFLQS